MSAIPELDVMRALPEQSARALARFTTINPSYRGADWSDCLSVLCDSDANLEVTEPLWEALDDEGYINDDNRRFITPVTLTFYYAGDTPNLENVKQGVAAVDWYLFKQANPGAT